MNRKILFTPVGGTDPISNFKDASILHICRIYKPDEIYMFLSKEMYENHIEDNRYIYCLDKLGEMLNHKFIYHIIKDESLVEVQEYDIFYNIFRKNIEEIQKKMDGTDILYVNTSSGTPSMKSALFILATISDYKFVPLQVSTPLKKINAHLELSEKYDVEYYWENNEDNRDDFENRCKEVKSINLVRIMKLDLVKKHIDAFDYNAAVAVAETMETVKDTKLMSMLYIAKYRSQLNIPEVVKLARQINWDVLPIKNGEHLKIFEYAMLVWLKVQRGEYADFIRSLTPLIVELEKRILKKACKIDIEKVSKTIIKNKENMLVWDEKLMNQENPAILKILNKEYNGFKFGTVYSSHISTLIQSFSNDSTLIKEINKITDVEQKVRNIAAHTITLITDKEIVQKVGITSNQILEKIKYMTVKAGVNVKTSDWNTYVDMNNRIKSEIDGFGV